MVTSMQALTLIRTILIKSQTGYVFILNGGAVSWCSSKQSVVAGSTCEAEYIAALEAANEGVWMKGFISDLGVILMSTTQPSSCRRCWASKCRGL